MVNRCTRRQQEEGGHDITHVSDEPDIETPDGAVDTHSQCDLTELSTKETLSGTITQLQDEERTHSQELVKCGREDTPKANVELGTGDEVEEIIPDIRCGGTSTHQHKETIKNGIIPTTSNMLPYTK